MYVSCFVTTWADVVWKPRIFGNLGDKELSACDGPSLPRGSSLSLSLSNFLMLEQHLVQSFEPEPLMPVESDVQGTDHAKFWEGVQRKGEGL